MNRQNKGRHHHSLSMGKKDSHIHDLLSPIIETVRNNKINSFFQLRTKFEDQSPSPSFIFQPYAATPPNPQAKMYMTMHNTSRSPRNNPEKSPKTAGSPTRTSNYQIKDKKPSTSPSSNQKKLFRINSKIKKHLVESIDFEQIQKMLFKKRDCVTQYEHYLQVKAEKNKKSKFSFPTKQQNQNERPKMKREDNLMGNISNEKNKMGKKEQKFYQTMPIRSTNKKRLWVKDRNRRNKSTQNGWLSAVQGHSFQTIQH